MGILDLLVKEQCAPLLTHEVNSSKIHPQYIQTISSFIVQPKNWENLLQN